MNGKWISGRRMGGRKDGMVKPDKLVDQYNLRAVVHTKDFLFSRKNAQATFMDGVEFVESRQLIYSGAF